MSAMADNAITACHREAVVHELEKVDVAVVLQLRCLSCDLVDAADHQSASDFKSRQKVDISL